MKVGVLGGGQLGRMTALAGRPLGLEFVFLEPGDDPPVRDLGPLIRSEYDDESGLARLAEQVDVVTYEFENVPVGSARFLGDRLPVRPTFRALEMAQDRVPEKEGFRALGIGTAPFQAVDSLEGLRDAAEAIGLPAVLKTRRFGYDGKGQFVIRSPGDVEAAWEALGGVRLILEGFVDFSRELSIVGARGLDGELRCFPLAENHHADGILRLTLAPAPDLTLELQEEAEGILRKVMESLDYVGVLAIELFQVGDHLLANEMAPRVHNSGHWTQDGASVSQFENHLRGVCGLPLGPATEVRPSAMVNFLGSLPDIPEVLRIPGTHLHLYGKDPRPGRKIGHVNVVRDSAAEVAESVERIQALLPPAFG